MPSLLLWVDSERYLHKPSDEFPRVNDRNVSFFEAILKHPELSDGSVAGIESAIRRCVISEPMFAQLSRIYPGVDFGAMVTARDVVMSNVMEQRERWRRAAVYLMKNRAALHKAMSKYYENDFGNFPLLTHPSWKLRKPILVRDIALSKSESGWNEDLVPTPIVSWPQPLFFSSVLQVAKRENQILENWDCYRLIDVEFDAEDCVRMRFGRTKYFDFIDSLEVLGAEAADAEVRKVPQPVDLPMRDRVRDVFDFKNRSAIVGLSVFLVLKNYRASEKDRARTAFLLHNREGGSTIEGIAKHVVPAGTFQPLARDDADPARDFDLHRAIFREFVEELFDFEAAAEPSGNLQDVLIAPEAEGILQALSDEQVTSLHFFGLGIDPVNTKPEMLFAMVTDWNELLRSTRLNFKANKEGVITFYDLSREKVRFLSNDQSMLPAGRACLKLVDEFWDYLPFGGAGENV